jgi:hypothetical protein
MQRAVKLDPCDSLATVLFQVTGPAHIPWQDPRWQELLHGYNVWVHVEVRGGSGSTNNTNGNGNHGSSQQTDHTYPTMDGSDVMAQACQSLLPNAARSSNLAALSMHVTRMLRELLPPELVRTGNMQSQSRGGSKGGAAVDGVQAFSNRIAVVGKARATAGAMNLLRILAHAVIVEEQQEHQQSSNYVQEVFLYKSRDTTQEHDTAKDLLQALLHYIVSVHGLLPNSSSGGMHGHATSDQDSASGSRTSGGGSTSSSHAIPELYDTTVLALQLLITLLSSQLYQPMISSFQRQEQSTQQQQQYQHASSWPGNYFLEQLMRQAAVEQARQVKVANALQHLDKNNEYYQDDDYSSEWTPQSLLAVCLDWQIRRPPAPEKSIASHNTELAESVVQVKGERRGADGMYESHLVVAACAPPKPGQTDTSLSLSSSSHHSHGHFKSNVFLDATKGVLVLSSSIMLLPFRLMSLALSLFHHREKGYDTAHRRQMQLSFQASNRTKDVLWITKSPSESFVSASANHTDSNKDAVQKFLTLQFRSCSQSPSHSCRFVQFSIFTANQQ